MHTPELLISSADGKTIAQASLEPVSAVTIGRSNKSSIYVDHSSISRHHVLVFDHDGEWYASDLGSTFGLGNKHGATRFHHFSTPHDWVRMGPAFIWVMGMERSHEVNRPSLLPNTPECRVQFGREFDRPDVPTEKNHGNSSNLQLIFQENLGSIIRVIDLSNVDRLTIGRSRNCDVVIDDPEVSRLHCILYQQGKKFFVADAGSSKGLRANGNRWLRKRLETGTLLQFGAINAVVAHPESPYQSDASTLDEISDGNDDLDLGSIFAEAESEAPQAPTAPDHH